MGSFHTEQYAREPRSRRVEIKGTQSYHCSLTFQFSRLRVSTQFEHLLFVAWQWDPVDWTDLHELNPGIWLGHVTQTVFAASPEDTAGPAGCRRRQSWLDVYKWVSFRALNRVWWDTHVTGRASAELTGTSY